MTSHRKTTSADADGEQGMQTSSDNTAPVSPRNTSTAYLENAAVDLLRNLHQELPPSASQQGPVENNNNKKKYVEKLTASQMAIVAPALGPSWSQTTVASPPEMKGDAHSRTPASQGSPQNARLSPPKAASESQQATVEGPYVPHHTGGLQMPLRGANASGAQPMRGSASLLARPDGGLKRLSLNMRKPRLNVEPVGGAAGSGAAAAARAEEAAQSEAESSATAGAESRVSSSTLYTSRLTGFSAAAAAGLRRRSPDASSISTLGDAESQSFP